MSLLFGTRPGRLLLIALLALLAGCGRNDPVSRGSIAAFGTTVDLTLIGIDRREANEITRVLAGDLQRLESALHPWRESPLTRVNFLINEDAGPFAAPPSLLLPLRLSQDLAARSDGLFDPAIGHLVRAWGFQDPAAACQRPPPADLLAQVVAARPSVRDIDINGFRLSSSNPLVKLDFRDLLQGFVIDQVITQLQDHGIAHARVNMDGNTRAIGSRDGHPWNAAIRGPEGGGIVATLNIIGNEAAFTAGRYKRNFTWNGELYHDVIDPRTGYPARGTASVTVLHPDATTADAAATALFVAGPADWHRVARQLGVRYVMLTDDQGRIHMNPAMQSRVRLQRTDLEVIISEPLT